MLLFWYSWFYYRYIKVDRRLRKVAKNVLRRPLISIVSNLNNPEAIVFKLATFLNNIRDSFEVFINWFCTAPQMISRPEMIPRLARR